MEQNTEQIFAKICRTCLSETADMQSIFEHSINEKIMAFISIEVTYIAVNYFTIKYIYISTRYT